MEMIENIRSWFESWRYRRMIHQAATHYHNAGDHTPYAAAAHEMFLRGKLEEFRDFASVRYIEDRSLTLVDIKDEWLKKVVKPMADSPFTREDAKALKAAIAVITHREAYIGEAKKLHDAEIKSAITTARSKSGLIYSGPA